MQQNDYNVIIKKTSVVDVDESSHQLPPDKGAFQEFSVADYFCPDQWSKDGVFIRVEEGEPMWFDLRFNPDCACIPAIQRVNPITGDPSNLEEGLKKEPKQNYLVLPRQQWIDGYAKDGKVYQFRVTKSGEALAVNEYVLPKHMQDSHSIGFAFFGLKNPKPAPVEHHHHHPMWSIAQPLKHYFVPPPNYNHYYDAELGTLEPKYLAKVRTLRSSSLNSSAQGSTVCGIGGSSFDSAVDMSYEAEACIAASDVPAVNCFMADAAVDDRDFDKASMGMGGRIVQSILTDHNSVDYYVEKPSALLVIYFALPALFDAIIEKGKRQDAGRKDRHILSGDVAGIPVPLIK